MSVRILSEETYQRLLRAAHWVETHALRKGAAGFVGKRERGGPSAEDVGTEVGQVPQMKTNNRKVWQQFEGTPT